MSQSNSSLPNEIVQAIAISNAKSIGEQPAILANLALSNQVLNNNLQQQMAISQQTATNQVILATMSKCVSMISDSGDGNGKDCVTLLEEIKKMLQATGDNTPGGGKDPKPPPDDPGG